MNFETAYIDDVCAIVVNLDRATLNEADEFKELVAKEINAGKNQIVIDLSACAFLDSSFLGVLVSTLKKVTKAKGKLILVGFKPSVQSMFELTRMFRVFDTDSDFQNAVKSLQA